MEASRCQLLVGLILLLSLFSMIEAGTYGHKGIKDRVTCKKRGSKCFLKAITCPDQCPEIKPKDPKAKACFVDCRSPKCEPVCRRQTPNYSGAAFYDPRFIGGDNIVFYFYGKSNEHYTLLSDTNLQINARFIRHRHRNQDYTWIQAIGVIYGSHNFTLNATRAEKWNNEIDNLSFTYDGQAMELPEGQYSIFKSSQNDIVVLRTTTKNSVTITITNMLELSINVVRVTKTKTDNRIHNHRIPSNDSFAHLEVQFRFFNLSPKVEGILGRMYQSDFVNPAKPSVEMSIVGGEDKYRTSSLLSLDCSSCVFQKNNMPNRVLSLVEYGMMDWKSGPKHGYGVVCKKWLKCLAIVIFIYCYCYCWFVSLNNKVQF